MEELIGVAASSGIAIGKVQLKQKNKLSYTTNKIKEDEIDKEINSLMSSLKKAIKELEILQENARDKMGEEEAEIFAVQVTILSDPDLLDLIENKIKNDKLNAAAALAESIEEYVLIFKSMPDEYMRERAADVRHAGDRVLKILSGSHEESEALSADSILVAEDLTAADIVNIDTEMVKAIITREGSKTSHVAIMARSLGLPAVVAVEERLLTKENQGKKIIVDGNTGKIIINPEKETIKKYEDKIVEQQHKQERLVKFIDKKALTADGVELEILGNIGDVAETSNVLENGGQGIGLFRTEFLFMNRNELPTEEEQFNVYKIVAEKFKELPVTIRTLDIGGDKNLPFFDLPAEENPFLGYRATRVMLDTAEIFKKQLRAILRASNFGKLKIMFPFITAVEELRKAKEIVNEVKKELLSAGIDFNKDIEVGIMVEIPATAMIIDLLAEEADFLSIGTNDLIQYTNAVDRNNSKVKDLYTPYYPAVLRILKKIITDAQQYNIPLSICGEAAADELLLPFLLGTGINKLSMSSSSILETKELISKWIIKDARRVAEEACQLKSAADVKEYLHGIKR